MQPLSHHTRLVCPESHLMKEGAHDSTIERAEAETSPSWPQVRVDAWLADIEAAMQPETSRGRNRYVCHGQLLARSGLVHVEHADGRGRESVADNFAAFGPYLAGADSHDMTGQSGLIDGGLVYR